MEKKTIASVIMPTYNGSTHMRRAIESVLDQTFSDWELIIIDDASVDNTKSIVMEYAGKDQRITLLRNDYNLGIQRTLNKGLKYAKGKYIARIDDDDEWIDRGKLGKQIEFLENNKDYGMVGVSGAVVADDAGRELLRYELPKTDKEIRDRILTKNCFVHSSVVFVRDLVVELGGYDEADNVRHIEDYILWLNIGVKSKFCNLPGFMVKQTVGSNSISSRNKFDQLKRSLELPRKYKGKYPKYLESLFWVYFKLWSFRLFSNIPFASVKYKFLKIYKEF